MTDLPHSLKAEQALLGILLYDNMAIERVPANFKAEHMYDPVHAALCGAILETINRGGQADLIVLSDRFGEDQALRQMGGFAYLADLVDKAPQGVSVTDLCHLVTDKAVRRGLIVMGEAMVKRAREDLHTPALEMASNVEGELYALSVSREEKGPRDFADVLGATIQRAAEAIDRDGEMAGLSTGLMDVDKKLGGMAPGNLMILAARPSMGKTALAVNIGVSNALAFAQERQPDGSMKTAKGGVVAIFSQEMSCEELGMRILADQSGVDGNRITRGQLNLDEFRRMRDVVDEILNAPLYIDETAQISLEALATRCRRLKRTVGLDLVIVDYLQLMTIEGEPNLSGNDRVTRITQGLKALAKELNIPILALSQLTRKVEERKDKKPQLSDLKESGAIEQDADQVMFLYRHVYYLEREAPKEGSAEYAKWEEDMETFANEAELIIGKQRHGPVGTVKLRFHGETTKFSDTIKDEEFRPKAA